MSMHPSAVKLSRSTKHCLTNPHWYVTSLQSQIYSMLPPPPLPPLPCFFDMQFSFLYHLQVNSEPYAKGWFVKIKVADKGELDALMDAATYEKHCAESH